MDIETIIISEGRKYGIGIPEKEATLLGAHFRLMLKWNGRCHLSTVTIPVEAAKRHYLESYISGRMLEGTDKIFMDIGAGAGFPGIPVKIMKPDSVFHLVESNGRKAVFLKEIVSELSLPDVHIHECRFSDLKRDESLNGIFDVIFIKAVGKTPELMISSESMLKKSGRFIVFAGEELSADIEKKGHWSIAQTRTVPWLERTRILSLVPASFSGSDRVKIQLR